MRKSRTIYFNDARHHYLFVHEPPMRLEDAWGPVDEVAGTTVDTFSYGVSRADGMFYPSRVGLRFGANRDSFDMSAYWRVWDAEFDPGNRRIRVRSVRGLHGSMMSWVPAQPAAPSA